MSTYSSSLTIQKCYLDPNNQSVPFFLSGDSNFVAFTLTPSHSIVSLAAISESATPNSLTITNSDFANFQVKLQPAFLSSGHCDTQVVKYSVFQNFSTHTGSQHEERHGLLSVDNCVFSNNIVSDSEDTVYGAIVSGVSDSTLSTFSCHNCSFNRCIRSPLFDGSSTFVHTRQDHNAYCSSSTTAHCSTTSRILITQSQTFIFDDCTFTQCDGESSRGGALFVNAASAKVTIKNSYFTSCTTNNRGGAIYLFTDNSYTQIGDNLHFSGCTTTSSDYGGGAVYLDSSPFELRNSDFENCGCNNGGCGGAIYSYYSDSISISDTTFDTCTTSGTNQNANGGAITTTATYRIALSGCTFTKCSTSLTAQSADCGHGGAIYIYNGYIDCSITLTDFEECTSFGRGGGICVFQEPPRIEDYTFKLDSCNFDKCSVTGSDFTTKGNFGGGGAYLYTSVPSLIKNCTFTSCISSYRGGGLFFNPIRCTLVRQHTSLLEEVTFAENEASDALEHPGHDLYIYNPNDYLSLETCSTATDGPHRVCPDDYKLAYLPKPSEPVVESGPRYVVAHDYGDDDLCIAAETSACRTLASAYKLDSEVDTSTIHMVPLPSATSDAPTSFSAVSHSVGSSTLTLDAVANDKALTVLHVSTLESNLFSLSSGTLSLSTFTLTVDDGAVTSNNRILYMTNNGLIQLTTMVIAGAGEGCTIPTQTYLFDITNGQISLTSTCISSFTTTDTPLLKTASLNLATSYIFSDVTLSDITRQTGNGVVLELAIAANTQLTGLRFVSCSASDGSGGAIYATVGEKCVLTLNSLGFEDCSASRNGGALCADLTATSSSIKSLASCSFSSSNDPSNGQFLHISTKDGSQLAASSDFSSFVSSYESNKTNARKYWIHEVNPTNRLAQDSSLLHFKYAPTVDSSISEVYATNTGADISSCGWKDLPCLTLKAAVDHTNQLFTVKLAEGAYAAETASIPVSHSITIAGQTPVADSLLTTKNVAALTGSDSNKAFLVVGSLLTLSISNIHFSAANPNSPPTLKNSLIDASAGSLTLTNVAFSSLSFSSKALITLTCSATNTFTTGAVSPVTACRFSHITRRAGNGAVFDVSISAGSFAPSAVEISDCHSSAGYGGAISVDLSSATTLSFSGIAFTGTECSAKDSKGQRIYVSASDPSLFTPNANGLFGLFPSSDISSININSVASLYYASVDGVFFSLAYARYSPTANSNTDFSLGGVVSSAETGVNIQNCGWEHVPCRTVSHLYSKHIENEVSEGSKVTMNDGVYDAADIAALLKKKVTLTGQSQKQTSVSFNGNGLSIQGTKDVEISTLTVNVQSGASSFVSSTSTAALALSYISFKGANKLSLTSTLVDVSAGSLTLTAVTFSSIASSLPTISVGADVKYIEVGSSSSLSSVTRTGGDGGVVDIQLGDKASLNIASLSFTGCKHTAPAGLSNALYVDVAGTPSKFDIAVSFPAASLTRWSSNDINANLYIKCEDATTFITDLNQWKGTITEYDSTTDSMFWVAETTDKRTAYSVPLSRFLFSPSNEPNTATLIVDSTGVDTPTCGWSDFPCDSLSYAIKTHINSFTSFTVTTSSSLQSSFEVPESTSLSVTTSNDKKPVTVAVSTIVPSTEADHVITNEGTLLLQRLSFDLTSLSSDADGYNKNDNSFSSFLTSSTSLNLDTVLFEAAQNSILSFSLLSITCGTLSIHSFIVESLDFSAGVVPISLHSSLSTVTITKANISSLNLGTSFVALTSAVSSASPSLTISDSNFTSLASSGSSSPSFISSSVAATFSFTSCRFTSCTSTDSIHGGAVRLSLPPSSTFHLKESEVSSCSCKLNPDHKENVFSSADGKGGFLYLDCRQEDISSSTALPFILESVIFKTNNADVGKDVYVDCDNLYSQISLTQFQPSLEIYYDSSVFGYYDASKHVNTEDEEDIDIIDFLRNPPTEPETPTPTETETETVIQPETPTPTETETETVTQPETPTPTPTETETGTQPETVTPTQTESDTDDPSEIKTEQEDPEGPPISESGQKSEQSTRTAIVSTAAFGFLLLLLIIILIIIIYCCCKRKQEDEEEEEPEEKPEVIDAPIPEEDEKSTLARTNSRTNLLDSRDGDDTVMPTFAFTGSIDTFNMTRSLQTLPRAEGILLTPPHSRVLAPIPFSLFQHMHNTNERSKHNLFIWAAQIGSDLADSMNYLLDLRFSSSEDLTEDLPSTSVIETLLSSLSPHTILFTDDHQLALCCVPETTPVPTSLLSSSTDPLSIDILRYRAPEFAVAPEFTSRRHVENNAVYGIALILVEIITDTICFEGYSATHVADITSRGIRPDVSAITSINPLLGALITAAYAPTSTSNRPSLRELSSRLQALLPPSLRHSTQEGKSSPADASA